MKLFKFNYNVLFFSFSVSLGMGGMGQMGQYYGPAYGSLSASMAAAAAAAAAQHGGMSGLTAPAQVGSKFWLICRRVASSITSATRSRVNSGKWKQLPV